MSREAIRSPGAQPFEWEDKVSAWGWLAVGGVIAGTMGIGAWLAMQGERLGAVDTASRIGVFDVPVDELPDDVKAHYGKQEIWSTELLPSGPGWNAELRVYMPKTNVIGQEYLSWDGWEHVPGSDGKWKLKR